jgi:hypothetical protein
VFRQKKGTSKNWALTFSTNVSGEQGSREKYHIHGQKACFDCRLRYITWRAPDRRTADSRNTPYRAQYRILVKRENW